MIPKAAIAGGPPAVTAVPPSDWPVVSPQDILAVVAQLAANNISVYDRSHPIGTLEDAFCELTGNRYAIAYNSGTSALLACFYGLGLCPGDEVIVPSYTFWATVTPLTRLGLIPVFAEVDPRTLTLDPASVAARITQATRGVVVNHTWGNPADLHALRLLCDEHGLVLIEDASHAHGATYGGWPIGSFGHASAFSLQANKPVAAGEGGVLVTNDFEVYQRATVMGHFGPRGEQTVVHEAYAPFATTGIGYKMRIGALDAALAVSQLATLHERNQVRIANMQQLTERIQHLPGLTPPAEQPKGTHIYYGYKFSIEPELIGDGLTVQELVGALRAEGVQVKVADDHLMHRQPLFNDTAPRAHLGWPFTDPQYRSRVDNRHLSLPVTEELIPRICSLKPLYLPAVAVVEQYAAAFAKVWEWARSRSRV